jgi:hypothetical protein
MMMSSEPTVTRAKRARTAVRNQPGKASVAASTNAFTSMAAKVLSPEVLKAVSRNRLAKA